MSLGSIILFYNVRNTIRGHGHDDGKTETKSTGEEAMAIPAQLTGAEL